MFKVKHNGQEVVTTADSKSAYEAFANKSFMSGITVMYEQNKEDKVFYPIHTTNKN